MPVISVPDDEPPVLAGTRVESFLAGRPTNVVNPL